MIVLTNQPRGRLWGIVGPCDSSGGEEAAVSQNKVQSCGSHAIDRYRHTYCM